MDQVFLQGENVKKFCWNYLRFYILGNCHVPILEQTSPTAELLEDNVYVPLALTHLSVNSL